MTNDKLFWEKFGFTAVKTKDCGAGTNTDPESVCHYIYPNKDACTDLPEPTLENLFLYCEEKTLEKIKSSYPRLALFALWNTYIEQGLPHALALKKAIEEIVK